jgi:hypothetical protein
LAPGIATYLPMGNGGGSFTNGGTGPGTGTPIAGIPIGGGGTLPTSGGGGGTAPGGGGGGPDIPVVPLPLAGWLLASSLAALAGLSQRRRRSS